MPGRGGGRSRDRPSGGLPRSVQISKKISWLLRHGAAEEGLQLGPGGFLPVSEVLANRKIRSLKVTFDELREVVEDNDKQRFTLILASAPAADSEDGAAAAAVPSTAQGEGQTAVSSTDPKDYLIRANQGHSLRVEEDGLLTPVTAENRPGMAVHGTTHSAWPLIVASGGLKSMGRLHVHFATGLPAGIKSLAEVGTRLTERDASSASPPVISGMRSSSTILIFLDVEKAMGAGLKFWLSDNGVVLSDGMNGIVPLEFFERVEDRTGEGILLENGKIIKDAPVRWTAKKGGRS